MTGPFGGLSCSGEKTLIGFLSMWALFIYAAPHGAVSESAFARRTGKGKVTDEWVCGCQRTGKEGSLERTPFTHCPETVGASTLLCKTFFKFFDGKVRRFRNRLMVCPFQSVDLPGRIGRGTHGVENTVSEFP